MKRCTLDTNIITKKTLEKAAEIYAYLKKKEI